MSLRDELNSIHVEKERIENETFVINLNNCITQIKFVNSHSKTKTTFIIPCFLLGRPPYDNKKCVKFITTKLKLQGIFCKICDKNKNKIFIDWGKKYEISLDDLSLDEKKSSGSGSSNTILFNNPVNKGYDMSDIQMFKKFLK